MNDAVDSSVQETMSVLLENQDSDFQLVFGPVF